ncbi:MAG: shikimate kinase [Pseudomonadota bacterium]
MHVVFIYGPVASGKYTIGSAVAELHEIPLFHNHLTVDLVSSLFDFGSRGFKSLRADVWRSAFREAAREPQSFVFTFSPEATVSPTLVDELSEIVRSAGGVVFFVELMCSDSTIMDRLQLDSRKEFGKLTDPDLFQQIRAQGGFELQGMPTPDLRVDTESLGPSEAAGRIVEELKRRGLP